MAKMTFYVDLWPGVDPARHGLTATTQPGAKSPGTRRFAFDVTVPNSILFETDAAAPEVSVPRLVPDHKDE